jgi:hypothetical protein
MRIGKMNKNECIWNNKGHIATQLQPSHETGDDSDCWGSTTPSIAARHGQVSVFRAFLNIGGVDAKSSDSLGRIAME